MASVYMQELKEKYGDDEKRIKRSIRFRANIIILKMMYENSLDRITQKYKQWDISYIGKNGLYSILKTNRTDFSKMYNGHIYEARKKMMDAVKDDKYMIDALNGMELFKIGNMVSVEEWERFFERDEGKEQKEELERINNLLKDWIDNDGEDSEEDSIEYNCYKWLLNSIKEYVQKQNDTVDRNVNEKVQGFRSLSFEELDECHPDTISRMYKDIKKVYGYIDSIYKYKCAKK